MQTVKKQKKELTPGLHLEVFHGAPAQVNDELEAWSREIEIFTPINVSQGYSGGEYWLAIVYLTQSPMAQAIQEMSMRKGGILQ